ncbi:MAG TPA: hypothetical protein VF606_12330, partial [Geminicoccaceae bacterium]
KLSRWPRCPGTTPARQGPRRHEIALGTVVPPGDYDALYAAGARAIFPPGTVIAEAASDLLGKLAAELGHTGDGMRAAE